MQGFATISKIIGVTILLVLSGYLLYAGFMFITQPEMTLRLMRLGFELGAIFLLWMLTIGRKHK